MSNTTDVSIIVILANAIIFIVIGILREDPLSPGMLDVFFQKIRSCVFFTKREFLYLKIAVIFTSFCLYLSVEVCSLIPSLEMYCLLDNPPHQTQRSACGTNAADIKELSVYSLHRCALNINFRFADLISVFCASRYTMNE
jgi:hypothetical protein